jgi:aminopeptidase N
LKAFLPIIEAIKEIRFMKYCRFFFLTLYILVSKTAFADVDLADPQAYLKAEAEAKQRLYQQALRVNSEVTENQKKFDVVYYKLDLFPDAAAFQLYGNVTMRARSLDAALSSAELNFMNNMTVDSVFVNDRPALFILENDLLTVQLDRSYAVGELFTTRVVYHGLPSISGYGAFAFDSHGGKPMIWTLSEPYGARNWWPCKDAPIDKADSVDIRVKVASNLIVASNGSLKSVESSGNYKIFNWQERYPIATYLVSLAIHPYSTYSDWYVNAANDSMEVQFYVFADHLSTVRSNYAKTVSMIKTFSELFGEYPFFKEKYGHAEFTWGGGMEHQTLTSLGTWDEGIIAHELSHQWWGDMVTCEDFHHIWLNEGFATYCEALWWEQKLGSQALHQDMAGKVYLGDETIYVEDPLTEDVFYYPTTYAKGAWVLHMLRHVVGDDVFFDILHHYYDEFKFKTVTTEQFRDFCEQISGKDLHAFFQQWIYQGGVPFYSYMWESKPSTDGKGYELNVALKQVQGNGTVFQMPIDLTITTASGERTIVVENNQASQFYTLHVDEKPVDVILDRDNWILKQVKAITLPQFAFQSYIFADADGMIINKLEVGKEYKVTIQVNNSGVAAQAVSARLASLSDDVEIIDGESALGDVAFGALATNSEDAFLIRVKSDAKSRLMELQLTVSYDGGESGPFSMIIPLGTPTLLIVDDDAGATYESFYQQMTAQLRLYADTWSVDEKGAPALDVLRTYSHVVWFTGDDRTTTLTASEQQTIQAFLDSGGRLLLSGQSIGYDLVQEGEPKDLLFYTQVLHAEFVADEVPDDAAVGVQTDPVGKGLAVRFNDQWGGADNQWSKSEIRPLDSAVATMMYLPSRKTAAILYHDLQTDARLAYFAFGLEGVNGPREDSAAQVVGNVIAWFDSTISEFPKPDPHYPDTFVLLQNLPNPFNPSTTIQFFTPEAAWIEVEIHNILGETVRQLYSGRQTPGWHSLTWDGTTKSGEAAASGVYFLTVSSKSENNMAVKTVKMLKLN